MNYAKSVIYTIQKNDLVYVGSTTNFTKRKCAHKADCTNETSTKYNLKVYTMIRENGGWDSFEMRPYSEFPCETKMALVIEEERVRKLVGNLNSKRAHTTKEERVIDQAVTHKKYREENKDHLQAQKKIYYEENKVDFAAKCKIYYDENKVDIRAQQKIFRADNAEAIKLRRSIQIECKCGKTYCYDSKARHERSLFHIKSMFKNA